MSTMYDPNRGDRQPQIRFDAISEAWGMIRANMGTWVLITLVYMIAVIVIEFVVEFVLGAVGLGSGLGRRGHSGDVPNVPVTLFGSGLGTIIIMACSAFLFGGYFRTALKQVRGEPISVNDLFSCGDVLGALVIGMVAYFISIEVGFAFCIVPGVYLMGALMFTIPLIVDKKMGAVDALKLSYETLKGQAWTAFGFYFVASLLSSLGGLLCGVGILFTAPIQFLALAIVYRDFFGGLAPYAPQIEMPMPPQAPTPTSSLDV